MTLEKRQAFIRELWSWLGTPYRHFTRGKGRGSDCVFFIVESLHVIGELLGFEYRYTSPFEYRLKRRPVLLEAARRLQLPEVVDPAAGDLLLLRDREPYATHAAVFVAEGVSIACRPEQGVVERPQGMVDITNVFQVVRNG